MTSFQSFLLISIVLAAFANWPALGQSASAPPSRIGNIWDGRAHEPDPSMVDNDLKAKGYAPSPQRERVVTDEVEDLYQRLIQSERGPGQQTASRAARTAHSVTR